MDITKLIELIESFRTLNPEMQAQQMLTFLLIAEQPGITLQKLTEKLKVSLASGSRNMYALSHTEKPNKPGHDLVLIEANPANRRERIMHLTPAGQRFLKQIKSI